ncbi:MAG TPA: hypothetical protein VMM79_13985 [Longimicrobiales bacterium]|nr:hypothetical protein [Longimicrobiales bacterium]
MRMALYRTCIAALVTGAATGCAETTAVDFATIARPGILQLRDYAGAGTMWESARDTTVRWTESPAQGTIVPAEVLVVPETVSVGQPFGVRVTTIGDSGCWRAESEGTAISGHTVELTPFDAHSGHDICTTALVGLLHEWRLTLDSPGEWTVRVRGRIARYGDDTWETPVAVEKVIVVH